MAGRASEVDRAIEALEIKVAAYQAAIAELRAAKVKVATRKPRLVKEGA